MDQISNRGSSSSIQGTDDISSPTSIHEFANFDDAIFQGVLTRQEASKHLEIPPDSPKPGADCLHLELNERSARFSLKKQSAAKNLNSEFLRRQAAFKCSKKIPELVKGASLLNLSEFDKYDTIKTKDPVGNPSKKVARSSIAKTTNGDGDVWVEKICYTKKDRRKVTVFVSKKTGNIVQGEPPTGASKVIFLKNSIH